MPDHLDWLNEHMILLLHPRVSEVVEQEKLPLSTKLKALAEKFPLSEDYVKALRAQGNFKEACNFLAYSLHHRMAVWWAYQCVLDLREELKAAPHQPRDIADIAKPKPFKVPQWAKQPPEPPEDPQIAQNIAAAKEQAAKLQAMVDKVVPPEIKQLVDRYVDRAYELFKERYGVTPVELLDKAIDNARKEAERSKTEWGNIDPESPIFKAEKELKDKIEQSRQAAVSLIKKAVGEPDLELKQKRTADCLDAVFAYIAAPTEDNARMLLNLGNLCPDTPEGMLALVGFWSYGDMAPGQAQVIRTPPGLMANGLTALLLQCALKDGGLKNFDERYETYFKLGFTAACGRSNWGEPVERGEKPHQNIAAAAPQPRLAAKSGSGPAVRRFTEPPKED